MNIKEDLKKINFKDKKYIFPLIIFFPLLYLVYSFEDVIDNKTEEANKIDYLSTELGVVQDTILSKNDSYNKRYRNVDNRSMIQTIGDDQEDSLLIYGDHLSDQEKRRIDSLEIMNERLRRQKEMNQFTQNDSRRYYNDNNRSSASGSDEDFQQSMEVMRMLNEQNQARETASRNQSNSYNSDQDGYQDDPVKVMREQFMLLDSLEKANDPEYKQMVQAQNKLEADRRLKQEFLDNSFKVSKSATNHNFNTINKHNEDNFIKAVIDENIKGYLGSRIKFRLLDDVTVAGHHIKKGKVLYANISGFDAQRVTLKIVSILNNGEIIPVNLEIYDIDGMKGLYVPRSQFREMMRELGTNTIQGQRVTEGETEFFESLLSKAFSSTSNMVSKMIRENKAKLKYNSYIFLINEEEITRK